MTNVNILSSILKFLRGVFSYLLWFFFRLGTVTEVNTPCSPVKAQVESGKFPMCYILLFQESTVRSLCFASLIRFYFCDQVDCCIGTIYSFSLHCRRWQTIHWLSLIFLFAF